MKKDLIKNVIKPFFKAHGFLNKGVNFCKEFDIFSLKVDIQSQRYYKEENEEKFRLNFNLFILDFPKKNKETLFLMACIGEDLGSWVSISSSTSYEEISTYLQTKLEETLKEITEQTKFETILKRFENEPFDLRYGFLLKKFQPENFNLWKEKCQKKYENELQAIEQKISNLISEKELQLKRKKSLDQQILLEGIEMKIRNLQSKKEKMEHQILFLQNNPF